MRSVKFLVAAGAASLLSSMASAADMGMVPPPPPPMPPPPAGYVVATPGGAGYGGAGYGGAGYGGAGYGGGGGGASLGDEFAGWYLRGDIGVNFRSSGRMQNALDSSVFSSTQGTEFSSANSFSGGGGFRFNNWFRADLTGEFRASSQFSGYDRITFNGGTGIDTYRGNFHEWVVMGNAYFDLGTWFSLTPFVGGGIGGARVGIRNFIDWGISNSGGGSVSSAAFSEDSARWNLAWALHAGVSYRLAPNFTVELAYRYLDMGDALSGDLRTFDGVNNVFNPMTFRHLRSNDLKFGVRWELCPPGTAVTPVYAPMPPLMRRG